MHWWNGDVLCHKLVVSEPLTITCLAKWMTELWEMQFICLLVFLLSQGTVLKNVSASSPPVTVSAHRPQTGGQVTSLYQCSSNINCTPADRGMIPRELPEVHSAASADWWETALFCYHQCVVTEAVIRHHNLNGWQTSDEFWRNEAICHVKMVICW